jgi:hypothetical protein
MTITGGCLCGAVRYRIEAEPLVTRTCWCSDCQKFGAGNATVNVVFPAEAVTIEGELRDYASTADSGNAMHRRFCQVCGTPVTTGSEARPHLLGIRAGTLDDPEIARPEITIWTSSAPSWAPIDPNIPQEEGQPIVLGPPPKG